MTSLGKKLIERNLPATIATVGPGKDFKTRYLIFEINPESFLGGRGPSQRGNDLGKSLAIKDFWGIPLVFPDSEPDSGKTPLFTNSERIRKSYLSMIINENGKFKRHGGFFQNF